MAKAKRYSARDKFINPPDGVEFVRYEPTEAEIAAAAERIAAGEDAATVQAELYRTHLRPENAR